jgi:hypothetical protein
VTLWEEPLVSSQLLEFEVWNRLHFFGLGSSHGELAQLLIRQVLLLELSRSKLARALDALPLPVRTLDGLHLATMVFLREQGRPVMLASYDARLLAAARALGIEPWPL